MKEIPVSVLYFYIRTFSSFVKGCRLAAESSVVFFLTFLNQRTPSIYFYIRANCFDQGFTYSLNNLKFNDILTGLKNG